MNGIASDTLNELRDVLSDCGPFGPEEGRALSALFVETRLNPWRDAVPTADTPAGRIDALIDALHDQFNRAGENVLHLFVQVLQERTDEDTRCHQRLGEVAEALAADLGTGAGAAGGAMTLAPPLPPDPFVNQKDARARLVRKLRAERGRVHALTGLGGVGKTALAQQVVADVQDAFSGVLWVSLEGEPAAETVWQEMAAHYGQRAADPQRMACALLRQHRPLLVLDNAETAPDTAQTLLRHRNGATALVTSRDRAVTATYGRPETVQVLPREDAVALLLEKTGADDDEAADAVCALLGDLPQAIKLAAGYANTYALPLAGYADLLRQSKLGESLHLKQRRDLSVPVSFGLSWARLGADARQALAVLALDGGETTGAAAVAAGAGWEEDEARARRALDELVQRSLAERDGQRPGRARLHPLVRQYTREQLTNQQANQQTNHLTNQLINYYLAYAWHHRTPTAADYDALEAERPNLLAAMERAYQQEQWAQVRRFAWALCDPANGYLSVRGYWAELRRRLGQAVDAAKAEGHEYDTAAFAGNLAVALQNVGDYQAARREYERVREIFDQLGEQDQVAVALHQLGRLAQDTGEMAEARRYYEESLAIAEELGDRPGIAITLHQLGMLAQATGELEEARRYYEESLAIAEELGDRPGIAITLHQLGVLAQDTGEMAEARRYYEESLAIKEELGNRPGIAITLHELGRLAQATGEMEEARRYYEESLAIKEELGNRPGIAITLHQLGRLAQDTGEMAEARRYYEESLAINEELGNRPGIAITLGQLAILAEDEGDEAEAERLYKKTLALAEEIGDVVRASIQLFNLALLYEEQGNPAGALPLLEEAVATFARVGSPHAEKAREVLERVRAKAD